MGATYKLKHKKADGTIEEVAVPISTVDGLQTALDGKQPSGSYVTTNTAQTISGAKTLNNTLKIQSGNPAGAFVLGGNVSSTGLTANTRKLGRMGVPAYPSNGSTVTSTVAGISFDAQANANYADFGGHPRNTSSIAPDVIRFVVANNHDNNVAGNRTLAFQIAKQIVADSVDGATSFAGAKFFVPVEATGTITASAFKGNNVFVEDATNYGDVQCNITPNGFGIDDNENGGYCYVNVVDGIDIYHNDKGINLANGEITAIAYDADQSLKLTANSIVKRNSSDIYEIAFPDQSGTLATIENILTGDHTLNGDVDFDGTLTYRQEEVAVVSDIPTYSNATVSSDGLMSAADKAKLDQIGTGGAVPISSTTTSININASTVGAYFNLFGTVDGADELTIGSETIALDSNLVYFVSVEGMLYGIVSGSYIWRVTVRVGDDSGATSYYNYQITSTSGLNIVDTGQPSGAYCRYTGILCG